MSGLRWPEPIYIRVGYVFQSRFSAGTIRDRAASFRVGGATEECVKEIFWGGQGGGHACGFLLNFSKVKENANNDKPIDFFPHLQ